MSGKGIFLAVMLAAFVISMLFTIKSERKNKKSKEPQA